MTISVAIPDSSLKDEKTLENKTRKIGLIARACSIFKINEIIIYRDGKENEHACELMNKRETNRERKRDNKMKMLMTRSRETMERKRNRKWK